MAFATLAQVKLKMGITGTSLDARLQFFLDGVCAALEQVLGDLNEGTKTDNLSDCEIFHDPCCCDAYLSLRIRNITSITTIDGNVVDAADVKILGPFKDRVLIDNISQYLTSVRDFCYFDVVYEAGYDPIPDDLAFATACLVEFSFLQNGGKDITSEKLGPRTVSFGNIESELKTQFPDIINLYTKVRL